MAKQVYPYQETDTLIRNWLGTDAEVEDIAPRRSPGRRRSGSGGGKCGYGKTTSELPRLTPSQIKQNLPFIAKVKQVAANLKVKPEYLMGIMEIESASTFSPEVVNDLCFVGLIQFGSGAASDLKTTQEALSKMTDVEQMNYVEKYFKFWKLKPNSPPSSIYTAVFLPKFTNKPDDFIFATKNDDPNDWWKSNPGLRDNSRADKAIWKGHLGKLVMNKAVNYVGM